MPTPPDPESLQSEPITEPERRPSRFAGFVFVFSLLPPAIIVLTVLWPVVFKPDFGFFSAMGVLCPWSGALALSSIACVLALIATIRVWRNPELRGRGVGGSALMLSIGGVAVGVLPAVALVLTLIGGIIAAVMAIGALGSIGISGRPLGKPATGLRHLFASSRSIWKARAWDEARSIDAFFAVARDLEHLGAPDSLVQRALSAAQDEQRHAEIAADRAGGTELPQRCPLPPVPSRDRFVQQTVLEGCIGEAFAAAVLAEEGEAEIARDEAEHAKLAWDIVAWAGPVEVDIPPLGWVPSRQVPLYRQLSLYRKIRSEALHTLRELRS